MTQEVKYVAVKDGQDFHAWAYSDRKVLDADLLRIYEKEFSRLVIIDITEGKASEAEYFPRGKIAARDHGHQQAFLLGKVRLED